MAYITQYQADMDQNTRNAQNQAAIGQGFQAFANAYTENRRRAIDAEKLAKKEEKANELFELEKEQKQYGINQLKKPLEERDSYKQAIAEAKARGQLELGQYEAKMKLENQQNANKREADLNQEAQKKIVGNNVQLSNVRNAMATALTQLESKDLPEDEKIKAGQGLLKLLNSAEGSDAVGAEEAKRLGSYLEYQIANFTQPGAFIGRDVGGFTNQVKNYKELLEGRIKRNEDLATGLRQGRSFTEMTQSPSQDQKLQRLEQLRAKKAGVAMGGN